MLSRKYPVQYSVSVLSNRHPPVPTYRNYLPGTSIFKVLSNLHYFLKESHLNRLNISVFKLIELKSYNSNSVNQIFNSSSLPFHSHSLCLHFAH